MAGVCKKKIYIYMSHSLLASLFFKQRVRKKIDLKYIPREPRVLSNRQYFINKFFFGILKQQPFFSSVQILFLKHMFLFLAMWGLCRTSHGQDSSALLVQQHVVSIPLNQKFLLEAEQSSAVGLQPDMQSSEFDP